MKEKAVFKLSAVDQWIGHPLGSSDWVFIDQTQVNIFGEISRWRTPGHCDPEYAKTSPLWRHPDPRVSCRQPSFALLSSLRLLARGWSQPFELWTR